MNLTLAQIDQGIDALLANSAQLIAEAKLLLHGSAWARAFALAHLAREEMSRAVMLQATGFRIWAGHPVDWKELNRRLKDHRSKLRMEAVENAVFILGAQGEGPGNASAEALLSMVGQMAEHRNREKNRSLYVEFEHDGFVTPNKYITQPKAERTVRLAELRLDELQSYRGMVPRYSDRAAASISLPQMNSIGSEHIIALAEIAAKLREQIMGDSSDVEQNAGNLDRDSR